MARRRRRTHSEIEQIRGRLVEIISDNESVTLSQLIRGHGRRLRVKNTLSDRNLVKRQLDMLAEQGTVNLRREGRDIVARSPGGLKRDLDAHKPENSGKALKVRQRSRASQSSPQHLDVIKAYALQLEEFSGTLQEQIRSLVRMIEKLSY